jgi:polar amino acid transport system substrate-binding protein
MNNVRNLSPFLPVLFLLIAIAGPIFAQTQRATPKIRILTNDFEPYHGEELPRHGPFLELVETAYRRMGFEPVVEFLPWARAIAEGRAGNCEVIAGVWHNTGREAWMAVSNPILENEIGLYKLDSDTFEYSGYESLRAESMLVGGVKDYIYPKGFKEAGIPIEEVTEDILNIKKLVSGRIRLALIDKRMGAYFAETLGVSAKIRWLATLDLIPLKIGIMKNLGFEWERNLLDFNAELAKMKEDGTFRLILERHGYLR